MIRDSEGLSLFRKANITCNDEVIIWGGADITISYYRFLPVKILFVAELD